MVIATVDNTQIGNGGIFMECHVDRRRVYKVFDNIFVVIIKLTNVDRFIFTMVQIAS